MNNIFKNIAYYLNEAKTMFKLNLLSNILSLFSTGLIFFIFAIILSGCLVSNQVVEIIQGEAEISVYFDESIGDSNIAELVDNIKGMKGVQAARMVGKDEAYGRMVEVLGKEAKVLEFFDDNPFSSFIEVKIDLKEMDAVLEKLNHIKGVDYVRDNREVLDKIRNIAGVLKLLGYLVVIAVGISTLVIISHIIRLGVYNNRDQINTLRLLGAPEVFIAFPFLLEGLLLTLGGGILAAAMTSFTLEYVYVQISGPLPFIPLPPIKGLVSDITILVVSISAVLGVFGSLIGLSSSKDN